MTRFDLHTIPVKDISYQVTLYSSDQASTILDAFAQWQDNEASDIKSTVALIMGIDTVTVGLIYSAPVEKPVTFAPFYDLPPGTVAVRSTVGTVLRLTQILGAKFQTEPMR